MWATQYLQIEKEIVSLMSGIEIWESVTILKLCPTGKNMNVCVALPIQSWFSIKWFSYSDS